MGLQLKYLDSSIQKLTEKFQQYEAICTDPVQHEVVKQEYEGIVAKYKSWVAAANSISREAFAEHLISKVDDSLNTCLQNIEMTMGVVFVNYTDTILKLNPELYSWGDDPEDSRSKLKKSSKKQYEELLSSPLIDDSIISSVAEFLHQKINDKLVEMIAVGIDSILSKSEKEFSKHIVDFKDGIKKLIETDVADPENPSVESPTRKPVPKTQEFLAIETKPEAIEPSFAGRNSNLMADLNRMLSAPPSAIKNEEAAESQVQEVDHEVQKVVVEPEPEPKKPAPAPPPRTDLDRGDSTAEIETNAPEKKKKGGFKAFFGIKSKNDKEKQKQKGDDLTKSIEIERIEAENNSNEDIEQPANPSVHEEEPRKSSIDVKRPPPVVPPRRDAPPTEVEETRPVPRPVPPRSYPTPSEAEETRPVPRAVPPRSIAESPSHTETFEDQSDRVSVSTHNTEHEVPKPKKLPPGCVPLPGHGAISALAMAVTGKSGPPPRPAKPKGLESPTITDDIPSPQGSPPRANPPPIPKRTKPSGDTVESFESEVVAQVRLIHTDDIPLLNEPLVIKKRENTTSGDDKAIEKNAVEWLNANLAAEEQVVDLYGELGDGLKLIHALESSFKENIGKYNKRILVPAHRIDNITVALRFLDKKGVPTDFLSAQDLINQDRGKILTLFNYISKLDQ